MGLLDLAVRVLQQQRIAAVQHPGTPVGERRGILAECRAAATGLDTDDFDAGIGEKGVKQADGSWIRRRRRR